MNAFAGAQRDENADTVEGLTVRDLSGDELSDAGVRSGVLVTDVADGSAAQDKGIQPNDIIEEVGGKPANGISEFKRLLRAAKTNPRSSTRTAILLVNHNGDTRFVAIPLTN